MRIEDIQRMAHDILEKGSIENDYIEYKKSATFKDKILKTICAFANNYMNREIGLLFIGIEEVNDPKTGEKAIPKRPIYGIEESLIESTENSLKQLLANIYPKVSYHLITDVVDDRNYIIVAVEPGTSGPYQTSDKAESDKDISLKAGRYIRVKRDSRLPNFKEEYELLRKFAHDVFSSNLNETATLDDLSYEYMKEYLISTNAREDIRNQSKLDMAKSMGLISESEYGGYRAKNFAVLMFTEKPDKFIPYAHVEIIREAIGTDKMEAKIFDGPIWIQAKQVSRYFKDNIMASYTVRDSETIEHRIVYNWPLTVFEELATNCILHKQYESPNYIGIYIYNDTTITEETEENVIYLIRTCKDIISTRPQFDYNKIFKNNMKQIMRGQEKNEEGKIIVKYMLNQEVKETEKRNIEYKEIKGSSPINAIIDVAEIYINAFLNSRVVGIGTIKWGISDKRIVKGVKLSKDDQDVISRKIAERVGQMKPYVSSDCVEVIFQNIADESKIIEELYVVEVVVKSWTNDILFSTSKSTVYKGLHRVGI